MPTCRFCKREIPLDATRCPHCTSFLADGPDAGSSGQITYIVDKGLISFLKIAGSVLAIFLVVGLCFYSLDLKQLQKESDETRLASQKLDLNIKAAQADLDKQLLEMKKNAEQINTSVAAAHKSAEDANNAYVQLSGIEKKAEESGHVIESYKIQAVRTVQNMGDISKSSSNITPIGQIVDAELLEILRNVLPDEQYVLLQSQIKKQNTGLRRRIYDAQYRNTLPGKLVRSEGDAPIGDEVANEVYENLGIVHKFFREVFGQELVDDTGGTLTASIHYESDYDNGFWNGQQIVLGDGDGKVFAKGAFSTLSIIGSEISHAVTVKIAGLTYMGQAGALNTSFSDVFSTLIEQWKKKQTVEEASWLVMEGAFASEAKGIGLRSLKEPGFAFKDIQGVGSDRQISTIARIYSGGQDNGGVHINSGIPNKAFYELARRLKGYAWETPAKIWWRALHDLKSTSTFEDFANATVSAAENMYGPESAEDKAVVQSWAMVGIRVKS